MVLATFKLIRIFYRLFSIALVITTGAWGFVAFRLVAGRLFRRMWRVWMRPKQGGLPDGDAVTIGHAGTRRQRARNRKGKIARDLSCQERDLATHAAILEDPARRDKLSDTVEATLGELKDVNGWLSTTAGLIKRKIEAERKGEVSDFDKRMNAVQVSLNMADRDEAP
jgi:hypothetical protein